MKAGKIFKGLRKRNNLTQATLAKLVGITPNHLALLERGERPFTIPMLRKFCDILGVSFTVHIGSEWASDL